MKDTLFIIKYLFPLFCGWCLSIIFITFLGLSTLPNLHPVESELFFPSPDLSYWDRWANWDGGHFQGIAQNGYLPIQTVFFPFYPLLSHLLVILHFPTLTSGLIISYLSAFTALFFLYKLARIDYNERLTQKILFVFLIFPTSFYLISYYSEALFLALTLAAFYYARKNYWFISFLLAGLTAVTRLAGLAVIAAIAAEYFLAESSFSFSSLSRSKLNRMTLYFIAINLLLSLIYPIFSNASHWQIAGILLSLMDLTTPLILFLLTLIVLNFLKNKLSFSKIISLPTVYMILSFLPIALYILFQHLNFHNPLGFLTNESSWHRAASFPWDPPIGYWRSLAADNFFQIGNSARSLTEFLFFLLLGGGLIASLSRLRQSYVIYYLLTFILPLLSGTLIAFPRYALTIFPFFFVVSQIKNESIQKIGIIFSVLLLGLYAVLFINSYWVT